MALGVLLPLALGNCNDAAPVVVMSGSRMTATLTQNFDLAGAPGRQAAFSADGTMLATSNAAGEVTLRRMSDRRIVRKLIHPQGATSLEFNPAGQWLASGGYDGKVRIWDVVTGGHIRTLAGAEGTVWTVDVSPDGQRIAAAGEDKIIRIWRVSDGLLLRRLVGHERNVWEARFSPDGKQLASGSFDASVLIWEAESGALIRKLAGHEEAVVGLDYSPDGRLIATGSDDSTVRIWRSDDGSLMRTLPNGGHAYKIAFSKDGRWLANGGRARGAVGALWYQISGAGGDAEPVHLWRVSDGGLVQALKHPDDVMYVAFSPDGRWLVTAGEDAVARLWRVRTRPER